MPEFTALTDLTTVQEVIGGTESSSDNALLNQLISAVSAAISTYCNRNFGSASYTETYSGDGQPGLWLNQRPVTAVASVTMNGLPVQQQPANQPWVYGWAFDQNRLVLIGGRWWEGFQNIAVTYTAGLSISSTNFPDLWRAAAEWVVASYKTQQHLDKKSDAGVSGQGTSYLTEMPWSVQIVIDRYKQVAPVQNLGI